MRDTKAWLPGSEPNRPVSFARATTPNAEKAQTCEDSLHVPMNQESTPDSSTWPRKRARSDRDAPKKIKDEPLADDISQPATAKRLRLMEPGQSPVTPPSVHPVCHTTFQQPSQSTRVTGWHDAEKNARPATEGHLNNDSGSSGEIKDIYPNGHLTDDKDRKTFQAICNTASQALIKVSGHEESFDTSADGFTQDEPDPKAVHMTESSARLWRQEQIFLNGVLVARDKYTLMPKTWAMHFRGIPLPPNLFYEKTNAFSSRPRIYAHFEKNAFGCVICIRNVAEAASRIRDLRIDQMKDAKDRSRTDAQKRKARFTASREIAKKSSKVLYEAIHWSRLDGDTAKFKDALPPNIQVIEHSIGGTSEESIRTRLFEPMHSLAQLWRTRVDELSKSSIAEGLQAPVIYGFVVINHLLYIVSMDASDPQAAIHNPVRLNLAVRDQQQWNAFAIMVTVCWARDKLKEMARQMKINEPDMETDSDPDA